MKKPNFILIGGLIALIFLAVLMYFYTIEEKAEERYQITVVMDKSDSKHWSAIKQGMDQGASDYNMELNFLTVSNEQNTAEQVAIIKKEMQTSVDGFIIDPVDSERVVDTIDAASLQNHIVLIETPIESRTIYPCIRTDNYAMGKTLGNEIIKDNAGEVKVGIIIGNGKKEAYRERLRGLKETLQESETVRIAWEIQNDGYLLEEAIQIANEKEKAQVIVGLCNISTEAAIDAEAAQKKPEKIYGIGNTEKIVYYVDKGMVDTLLVPNEFNMGYLAVEAMEAAINHQELQIEDRIPYHIITKNNMYLDENQKILFPIVQ